MEYDYIIVGAGIAGLHCALRISKAFPKATIAITEMYNYTGGRMFTFHQSDPSLTWEAGAGRIHESHLFTKAYLKHYGLTLLPISSHSQWISEDTATPSKDIWPSLSDIFTTALENLHPSLLATHTVEDILQSNYLTQRFPYKSELSTMRADLAIKSLQETMGSSEGFYVVKEGFSSLANKRSHERKENHSRHSQRGLEIHQPIPQSPCPETHYDETSSQNIRRISIQGLVPWNSADHYRFSIKTYYSD